VSTLFMFCRPWKGSSGQSPAFHRGGPGSFPSPSMRDLRWTNW